MKKVILAMVLLVSSFYTTVQADTGKGSAKSPASTYVERQVKYSFMKRFPQAQFAVWQQIDGLDLYLVRFLYNEEGMIAYIDSDGSVVATVRSVVRENLPLTVSQELLNQYGDFEVKEVLEMILHDELNYLVTVENGKKRITVRIHSNGTSSEVKKERL